LLENSPENRSAKSSDDCRPTTVGPIQLWDVTRATVVVRGEAMV